MSPELSCFEPIAPTRPIAPYVGGKRILAKRLISMIDATEHHTYAEPFVGMGGVFLRRHQRPRAEAINDLSGDVSTFFRILQRHYVAFLDMLRFQITSRAEFDRLKRVDPETLTDLERAARFLYLQSCTYGGLREGAFAVRKLQKGRIDLTRLQPLLEDLHERLSAVTIERLPFENFMQRYDAPGTLFFIDSPYWGVEDLYGKNLFHRSMYDTLVEQLRQLQGKFVLTINDVPATRALFAEFNIEPVTFRYSVALRHTEGAELIVTNR